MSLDIQKLQHLCSIGQSCFSDSGLIIAGGAPRDVLSGVAVKDIDMFVSIKDLELGSDTPFTRACLLLADWLQGTAAFRPPAPEYPDALDLCDITGTKDGVLQVVGLRDAAPIDDVPSYDFGLSQVFVTPTGLFFTEAAAEDRQNKTITHVAKYRDEHAQLRSKARLGRLREKYQGWEFLNCETLDALEAPLV